MVLRCIIPSCSSFNWKDVQKKKLNGEKVESLFRFPPKDTALYKKWMQVIPHSDRGINKMARVCALHFKKEDIITHHEQQVAYGTVWKLERIFPKLKKGSVPSIFPDTTSITKIRKHPVKRNSKAHKVSTKISASVNNKLLDSKNKASEKNPSAKKRKLTGKKRIDTFDEAAEISVPSAIAAFSANKRKPITKRRLFSVKRFHTSDEETEISVSATIGKEFLEPKTEVLEKVTYPCTKRKTLPGKRIVNTLDEATEINVPAAVSNKLLELQDGFSEKLAFTETTKISASAALDKELSEDQTEVFKKIALNQCSKSPVEIISNAFDETTEISVPTAIVSESLEPQIGDYEKLVSSLCSYDYLRKNISSLTKNSSWSSTISKNFTALILWNLDSTVEKWIVFTNDLKTKVFIKGVETSFGNHIVLSFENISILMKVVEEVIVCKGNPDIENCLGYVENGCSKQGDVCVNCQKQKNNLFTFSSLGMAKRRQYLAYVKRKKLRLKKKADTVCLLRVHVCFQGYRD